MNGNTCYSDLDNNITIIMIDKTDNQGKLIKFFYLFNMYLYRYVIKCIIEYTAYYKKA